MAKNSCTYCLLLRNGQSIQINEAAPDQDEVEFVAAARLAAPQSAWLQRSSDGSTLEVRILRVSQHLSGAWRYTARLEAESVDVPVKADDRAWSFMRRK